MQGVPCKPLEAHYNNVTMPARMTQIRQVVSRVQERMRNLSSSFILMAGGAGTGSLPADHRESSERARSMASDGSGRSPVVRLAVLGFVAILAITYGASQPSSPFALKLPGAWFFGISASPSTSQQGLFVGLVAVYGGLFLLLRVWYELVKACSRHEVSVRDLGIVFGLWMLPLMVAPPLFSRDVYSYAAQGEMMSRGISPYRYGPAVLGAGPYVTPVDSLWLNTPAPYGPLFLGIAGFIAKVTLHNALATVVGFRLLALAGVVLIAISVPTIARSYGANPGLVFVFAVLNPVTMLQLVGGAHNDALMLGLLAVSIALARKNRTVWAIVVCALATAVKVPAALGIVYIGWDWMGTRVPWRERIRPVVTAGLIGLGVMGAVSLVVGLGWRWVLNLATPGTVRSWLAPATAVGLMGGDLLHAVGLTSIPTHIVLSLTRVLGLGLAAAIGLWLLWNSERIGSLKAMGVTMLLVVALGPVVQPWYLSWGLIILAPVVAMGSGVLRKIVIVVSLASPFIGLPGGRQLLDELIHANPLLAALSVAVLVTVLTAPLDPVSTWLRASRAAADSRVDNQGEGDGRELAGLGGP